LTYFGADGPGYNIVIGMELRDILNLPCNDFEVQRSRRVGNPIFAFDPEAIVVKGSPWRPKVAVRFQQHALVTRQVREATSGVIGHQKQPYGIDSHSEGTIFGYFEIRCHRAIL
jgi:hypothetical protein